VKTNIAIAIILVFTAGMLLGWEIGIASQAGKAEPLVPVLVARQDIPAGTFLDDVSSLFMRKMYHPDSAPPSHFSQLGELRKHFLTRDLRAGEPCTPNDIQQIGSFPPRSLRAVTVQFRNGVDMPPAIYPGDRVNVVLFHKDPQGKESIQTLLENVCVLAVNSISVTPVAEGEPAVPNSVVTLGANRQGAALLIWGKTKGRLSITLRRPGDDDLSPPPLVNSLWDEFPDAPRMEP
jgi:Flp pilus assembly protein CpaB